MGCCESRGEEILDSFFHNVSFRSKYALEYVNEIKDNLSSLDNDVTTLVSLDTHFYEETMKVNNFLSKTNKSIDEREIFLILIFLTKGVAVEKVEAFYILYQSLYKDDSLDHKKIIYDNKHYYIQDLEWFEHLLISYVTLVTQYILTLVKDLITEADFNYLSDQFNDERIKNYVQKYILIRMKKNLLKVFEDRQINLNQKFIRQTLINMKDK